MSRMIRAFVAVRVDCEPELRRVLRELNEMGRAVRAMPPDQLHVTLKFLGDVPFEQTAAIAEALIQAVREAPAFTSELHGLGTFPHLDRPTVVWVGYAEPYRIVDLAERIERVLGPLGFPSERRPYHPHVTLARVKNRPPDTLRTLIERHSATSFGPAGVESVVLYQSEPGKDGPRYTVLADADMHDAESRAG